MIDKTVSHYRILERIGGGGMGEVYRARDTRLDRTVALKFLASERTSDPVARKRFVHEARSASALQHHNICTIHDVGETPAGVMYICMDCYDGTDVTSMIAQGPLDVAEAVDIAAQAADGLAAAHDAGMVHRDVKPANIIVTAEGRVKILDFGLAKFEGVTRMTKTGVAVGTVSYMSPEQARGDEVDHRSDIWSLGVVLYEMITGTVPFAADQSAAALYLITNRDPKPLSASRSDPGPARLSAIQRIVDKALQKDPEKRYGSARELGDDLRRVAAGLRPRAYRHRTLARAVAVLSVAAAALVVWRISSNIRAAGAGGAPIVAVLPFENVGGGDADRAFCDGLVATLSSQLSQVGGDALWVVPASEMRSRGVTSPREAQRNFGVDFVLDGSVQRLAGVYRVNLSLIRVDASGSARQVRADTFDENVVTIAALQDEAVKRVTDMLDIELIPGANETLRRGGTNESTAYRLYVQGQGYLERFERPENVMHAISAFEAAVKVDSSYALAYAGLGEAYWRRYGNTQDPHWIAPAVAQCRRALDIDGDLAVASVTLGMIHSRTGAAEKAVHEFDRALELEPANADAYRGLATAYTHLGQHARAESTYRRAIAMKPTYWAGYNELGSFFYHQGRYDEAIEQFDRVVELTPDNILGYNNLGACYWFKGDLKKAQTNFERSIALEKNYRACSNLSGILYIEGRYQEAADMSEEALALNNSGYRTWANLGNALHWIDGREDESRDAFREAVARADDQLTRTPDDPNLLASIAGYCAILGEEDRAVELAQHALELAPDNRRVCYFVGHSYEQLGNRDKALEYIARALALGYAVDEIEQDPFLRKLVADPRFQQLTEEKVP